MFLDYWPARVLLLALTEDQRKIISPVLIVFRRVSRNSDSHAIPFIFFIHLILSSTLIIFNVSENNHTRRNDVIFYPTKKYIK